MRRFAVDGAFFLHKGAGVQFFVEAPTDTNFIVTATVMLDEAYAGASPYVHSGILAALLDESMGIAAFYAGYPVVSSHLNFNYYYPTPVTKPFVVRAYLKAIEGRNLYTHSTIILEDETIAIVASGIFIAISGDDSANDNGWRYTFTEI